MKMANWLRVEWGSTLKTDLNGKMLGVYNPDVPHFHFSSSLRHLQSVACHVDTRDSRNRFHAKASITGSLTHGTGSKKQIGDHTIPFPATIPVTHVTVIYTSRQGELLSLKKTD